MNTPYHSRGTPSSQGIDPEPYQLFFARSQRASTTLPSGGEAKAGCSSAVPTTSPGLGKLIVIVIAVVVVVVVIVIVIVTVTLKVIVIL